MFMLAKAALLGSAASAEAQGITLVGTATAKNDGSSTLTITLPAGIQQGDVVLVAHGTQTSTTPSGYTSLFAGNELNVSYKVQTSTPDTAVPCGVQGAGLAHVGVAFVFRGVNAAGISATNATASSGTINPPSITTSVDGSCVFVAAGGKGTVTPSPGTITNYSAPVGDAQSAATSNASVHGCYRIIDPVAASEDPGTWWSTSAFIWDAVTVVLPPA